MSETLRPRTLWNSLCQSILALSPDEIEKMKKWKVAQKKLAWQATTDRNIGGHTARIPDWFTFVEGPGPRGIGIDLSSKDLIEKLAESIIPRTTSTCRSKTHQKLEQRWVFLHGSKTEEQPHNAGSAARDRSRESDAVRTLFDKSRLEKEGLKELISQLKEAVESTPKLEHIEEHRKGPKKEVNGSDDSSIIRQKKSNKTTKKEGVHDLQDKRRKGTQHLTEKGVHTSAPERRNENRRLQEETPVVPAKILSRRATLKWQNTVNCMMKSSAGKDISRDVERKGDQESVCSRTATKQQSQGEDQAKRKRSGEPQNTSPDSGFQSEESISTPMVNLPSRNQEQLNKVVSDILSSDTLTDLLKQCESGNDDEQSGNALLAMLQKCQDAEEADTCSVNSKMKKIYQVASAVKGMSKDKFIPPLTKSYYVPEIAKDGQSFTRRRTKGQMYTTLEPVAYSEVHLKKTTNLLTINKGKSIVPGFI